MSLATEETRRTAFRAAYLMGDRGKELFAWVAEGDDDAARKAAVSSLYLHWRRDPDYVFGLMDDLGRRVGLPPVGRNGRVLRFLADLSITIYINHPERDDVLHHTSDLWARVLIKRLRLNQLLFLVRLPFAHQVGRAFSGRTLETALLSELQSPRRFFGQTDEERSRFLRCVPFVDPDLPITTDEGLADLVGLLRSDILLHRILGALILAIHGVSDPKANESLLDKLLPQLDGDAALWALLAFAVPLPATPPAWIPLLERMTTRLIEGDRATFSDASGLLKAFDIALLPLGLAYGKHGLTMPLIDDILARSLAKDRELGLRIVRGLASVGFYYPNAVFATLRKQADIFAAPDAATSLGATLAAMRTLHFDRVDLFMSEMHASSALRADVAARRDPDLIARCINWVGFYNNAVHQALEYPAMRKTILIGGLQALGEARKPSDFIGPYTDSAIDMAARAGFQLIRWTEPSFDAPPGSPAGSSAADRDATV